MKINYKKNMFNFKLITSCYNHVDLAKVGSIRCQHCDYHISQCKDKQVVDCCYDEVEKVYTIKNNEFIIKCKYQDCQVGSNFCKKCDRNHSTQEYQVKMIIRCKKKIPLIFESPIRFTTMIAPPNFEFWTPVTFPLSDEYKSIISNNKIIKYKGCGQLNTKCEFNHDIKVGSYACTYCKHCVNNDNVNQTIECGYQKELIHELKYTLWSQGGPTQCPADKTCSIASNACKRCEDFVSIDRDRQIVKCKSIIKKESKMIEQGRVSVVEPKEDNIIEMRDMKPGQIGQMLTEDKDIVMRNLSYGHNEVLSLSGPRQGNCWTWPQDSSGNTQKVRIFPKGSTVTITI